MDDAPRPPAAPGPLASFLRLVVCGGGIGLLSSGAVALLAGLLPRAVANALITIASTGGPPDGVRTGSRQARRRSPTP
nr:hypothetical protein [Streptomyces dysideae]